MEHDAQDSTFTIIIQVSTAFWVLYRRQIPALGVESVILSIETNPIEYWLWIKALASDVHWF